VSVNEIPAVCDTLDVLAQNISMDDIYLRSRTKYRTSATPPMGAY
jgi:hypothetical protein